MKESREKTKEVRTFFLVYENREMEEIQRDRKLGKEAKFFFSKANLSPLDHMYRPICTTCADKHTHTLLPSELFSIIPRL